VLNRGVNFESVPDKRTKDVDAELRVFREAVRMVCEELTEQAQLMRSSLPEEECALFIAYAQMLSGGSLIDDTEHGIREGNWAPSSWRDTVEQHAHVFSQMEDRINLVFVERPLDQLVRHLMVLRKNEGVIVGTHTFSDIPGSVPPPSNANRDFDLLGLKLLQLLLEGFPFGRPWGI